MNRKILTISVLMFLICHVFSRAWFFIDYPFPMIGPDTISYYIPVWQIKNGEWPDFSIRTPGYPMFLLILLGVTQNILSVVYAQSILTALACILVIYSFWNIKPIYSLLISLPLSFWTVKSSGAVFYDLIVYSESLYSSLILFFMAFIIFAVVKNKIIFLFVASLLGGACIFVRPSGVILIPAFLILILRFIFCNKKNFSILLACIPLFCSPIMLSLYNWFLHNKFTPSVIGALATQIPSLYVIEPDNNYPDEINAKLVAVTKDRDRWLTQGILEFLMNSDPRTFSDIVSDSVGSLLYGSFIPHFSDRSADEYVADYQDLNWAVLKQRVDTYKNFDEWFFTFRQDLLVKHWRFNIKWFVMMMRAYYSSISNTDELVLAYMQSVTIKNYFSANENIPSKIENPKWSEQNKILDDFYRKYIEIPDVTSLTSFRGVRLQHRYDLAGRLWGDGAKYEMNESGVYYWITKTPSISVFLFMQKVNRLFFSVDIWLLFYLFVFSLTIFRLILTRFQHDGSLILMFLMLVLFFNAFVTAQAYFLPRYAYPFEWILLAILFVFPLIFVDNSV